MGRKDPSLNDIIRPGREPVGSNPVDLLGFGLLCADGHQPDHLADALHVLTADTAFDLLRSWEPAIDWAELPGGDLALADGARLRFDKRRRSASIYSPNGGTMVIDLGRRDRMRSIAEIVTSKLVRVDGPDLEVALTRAGSEDRGEVAVSDPLDIKGKRAKGSVPVGAYRTSRYVDPAGRPQLLTVGTRSRPCRTSAPSSWSTVAATRTRARVRASAPSPTRAA